MQVEKDSDSAPSLDEIAKCICVLEKLVQNTNLLTDLNEKERVALMKAAGLLSRPSRDEQTKRRKDARKASKRKMIERDKHARNETGIRSAREASVFVAPKLLSVPSELLNSSKIIPLILAVWPKDESEIIDIKRIKYIFFKKNNPLLNIL